jgi:hypothetical protein
MICKIINVEESIKNKLIESERRLSYTISFTTNKIGSLENDWEVRTSSDHSSKVLNVSLSNRTQPNLTKPKLEFDFRRSDQSPLKTKIKDMDFTGIVFLEFPTLKSSSSLDSSSSVKERYLYRTLPQLFRSSDRWRQAIGRIFERVIWKIHFDIYLKLYMQHLIRQCIRHKIIFFLII